VTDELRVALEEHLAPLFDGPVRVERLALLAGGASMEAWAVDAQTKAGPRPLLLRRGAGGRIFRDALSLKDEDRVLQAAWEAGVKVPRPYGYLGEVLGREAFVMERLQGETVGRRLVQRPEFAAARALLPAQLGEEVAHIHGIAQTKLGFLPGTGTPSPLRYGLDSLAAQLASLEEPHPALELGFAQLQRELPFDGPRVVCHGDFRVGNFMVGPEGLVAVLDWEFAHLGDPREDLGWAMVRAWRFRADHLRFGGIAQPHEFLDRYAAASGRTVTLEELRPFELLGNLRWAVGALTQARRHLSGEERSVELAVLGRLAAEIEHEVLSLLEEGGR
jgi:aminoglycoside phosphotransferase (APT) family kinase protein